MTTSSSLPASEALPEEGDPSVGPADPAPTSAPAPQVGVPAGYRHRLWRAWGSVGEEGRRGPPAAPRSLALAWARRLHRGGRAFLLWMLGLYAAVQLALILAMDYWQPTLTEGWKANKWEQLQRLVAREPDRPLAVMLGSSRTDDAFDAERLSEVRDPDGRPWLGFNFGVPMVGPMHELLYLDELLAAGIRPRLVLIEFMPALLNEPHQGLVSEENWTLASWMTLPEVRFLWPYWSHPYRKAGEWLEGRLAPWYAFRYPITTTLAYHLFPRAARHFELKELLWAFWVHDEQGYRVPKDFDREQLQRSWTGAWGMYITTLQKLRPGRRPTQALRDLLVRCRRERIPAALVFMPESPVFRNWYRPGALDEAHRLFRDLCWEHGAVPIDANDWIPDVDFRDGHHVQGNGARVFTTRLIAELRPLLTGSRDAGAPAPVAAAAAP
jgi:hypothetical protein